MRRPWGDEPPSQLGSALSYSTLRCSALGCTAPLYSTLRCCALSCSSLNYTALRCSEPLCSALIYSALSYSTLRCFALLCSVLRCSHPSCSSLLHGDTFSVSDLTRESHSPDFGAKGTCSCLDKGVLTYIDRSSHCCSLIGQSSCKWGMKSSQFQWFKMHCPDWSECSHSD